MHIVRITSGKFRGQTISAPGEGTHPMGAREKTALFNMIADRLPDATILDAYAGSGALGVEAISRGAKYAVFIEKSQKAAKTIRDNLAKLGLSESVKVIDEDVRDFSAPDKFGVVFADPPYNNFKVTEISRLIDSLSKDGILVLSHPGEAPDIAEAELLKTRQYAAAHISIYAKR